MEKFLKYCAVYFTFIFIFIMNPKFITTPIAIELEEYPDTDGYVDNYTCIYLFGIRIMMIRQLKG